MIKVYAIYYGKYEPEAIEHYQTKHYATSRMYSIIKEKIKYMREKDPSLKTVSNKVLKEKLLKDYFVDEIEII